MFIRLIVIVSGLVLAALCGCASTPTAARRDAGELREVALAPGQAVELAASVLATQGFELRPVSAMVIVGSMQVDARGRQFASTTAGATAGTVVGAAGGGPIGGLLAGLTVGLATSSGPREARITVQAVELTDGASAVRATAVVDGRIRADWPRLAEFWKQMAARATVRAAGEPARAALPVDVGVPPN